MAPHAFKQRRNYTPGAPLYAREAMKFSGVPVARGELIPARPEQHRIALWRSGKADHEPRNPYAKPALDVLEPFRAAMDKFHQVSDQFATPIAMPPPNPYVEAAVKLTPGERVVIQTPAERERELTDEELERLTAPTSSGTGNSKRRRS